jgi:hypothetical protein
VTGSSLRELCGPRPPTSNPRWVECLSKSGGKPSLARVIAQVRAQPQVYAPSAF